MLPAEFHSGWQGAEGPRCRAWMDVFENVVSGFAKCFKRTPSQRGWMGFIRVTGRVSGLPVGGNMKKHRRWRIFIAW